MRAAAVTSGWVSFNCLCLTCYRCQTWQDAVTLRASSAASRFRRYEPARLQRSRLHYAPNTYYSACLTYFNYHLPPRPLAAAPWVRLQPRRRNHPVAATAPPSRGLCWPTWPNLHRRASRAGPRTRPTTPRRCLARRPLDRPVRRRAPPARARPAAVEPRAQATGGAGMGRGTGGSSRHQRRSGRAHGTGSGS